MLQLMSSGRRLDRIRVAAAHIEAAIAHINNEAQTRVPGTSEGNYGDVTALRLVVVALSDIRAALKAERVSGDSTQTIPDTEAAAN